MKVVRILNEQGTFFFPLDKNTSKTSMDIVHISYLFQMMTQNKSGANKSKISVDYINTNLTQPSACLHFFINLENFIFTNKNIKDIKIEFQILLK